MGLFWFDDAHHKGGIDWWTESNSTAKNEIPWLGNKIPQILLAFKGIPSPLCFVSKREILPLAPVGQQVFKHHSR
jgi:hypothetical protein